MGKKIGCYSYSCTKSKKKHNLNREPSNKLTSTHWASEVPKEILDTIPKKEIERQECIYEFIATEWRFIRDLVFLNTHFVNHLREKSSELGITDVEEKIDIIFGNLEDIISVSQKFYDSLIAIQKRELIVDCIGKIILEFETEFEVYFYYGIKMKRGLDELAVFRLEHPPLDEFIAAFEKLSGCRKLPLQHFILSPIIRFSKYTDILLKAWKCTDTASNDSNDIQQAIETIRNILQCTNDVNRIYENKLFMEKN